MKKLKDMTLKELWELFPIKLVDSAPEKWKKSFDKERENLVSLLGDRALSVNHIGSTAVGTIKAKDIVDVLVETAPGTMKECACILAGSGYIVMNESGGRISLNKGYTPQGYDKEVFHIHLRKRGDNDEIYFYAYLKEHPEAAKEYEALKLSLVERYGKDRDGYTAAKGDMVGRMTEESKKAKQTKDKKCSV